MTGDPNFGKLFATGVILLFVVIGLTGSAVTLGAFQDTEFANAKFFANGPNLLTGDEETNDVAVTFEANDGPSVGGSSDDDDDDDDDSDNSDKSGGSQNSGGPPPCAGNAAGNSCGSSLQSPFQIFLELFL